MGRITQKEVARKAGVSLMTVSRSLKDSARVPVKERERIQNIAKSMGYTPDPMLSALASYRAKDRYQPKDSTIAIIDNCPQNWPDRKYSWFLDLVAGVWQRTINLGYSFEHIPLNSPAYESVNINRMLLHRGVKGIIIMPFQSPESPLELKWEDFSCVTIGYSLQYPNLHYSAHAFFQSMLETMSRLNQMGYKRIGFTQPLSIEQRMGLRRMAAYRIILDEQGIDPNTIPPYLPDKFNPQGIVSWMEKYQPDVIVGMVPETIRWLRNAGIRIPEDVGAVTLNHDRVHATISGIDQMQRSIGGAAVDLLHSLVLRGEKGIPKQRQAIITHGQWIKGETLKA